MIEPTTEGLVVYWRPLCGFCQRLLEALDAAGKTGSAEALAAARWKQMD